MESSSAMRQLSLPKNLRPKQIEVINAYVTESYKIIKLPVAYGKTDAACGAFAQLCCRSFCNRMLYVVARRSQADRAAIDVPAGLAKFGIETKSFIVGDNPGPAAVAHSRGEVLVFIVTVQSLVGGRAAQAIAKMMATGRWFCVVDEHHHYSNEEDAAWTRSVKHLNFVAMLAMSATPNRHDHSDHFGEPEISETYINAANDGYIKRMSLHAYHYEIDMITVDGQSYKVTTEELVEQAGSQDPEAIEKYLSSRKMRFSPKYISPLVTFPLDRIEDLRCKGMRSQMLVQAMSCSHAQCVLEQMRSLLRPGIKVDWVGTGPNGRPSEENVKVLDEFCPAKDPLTGQRPWTLDVLINVGMAGEGLDSIDVTEIVFLTPGNITISNLQTIGRGARIMRVPEAYGQPVCHVNVDTGSPMAEHVGSKIMQIFDEGIPPVDDPPEERTRNNDYEELPEKLSWTIVDMRLVDIRSEPMFQAVLKNSMDDLSARFERLPSTEEHETIVERAFHAYLNRNSNQGAILAQKRDQVNAAVSKLAGLVIRRIASTGIRIERSMSGDLRRRINTAKRSKYGAVEVADDALLDLHWVFLKELEMHILKTPGIDGIPQWLR